VFVPRSIDNIRWTDSNGTARGDPTADTTEPLPGNQRYAVWLTDAIERLDRTSVIRWVEFRAGTWCGNKIVMRI
jgi:hypothetical protein